MTHFHLSSASLLVVATLIGASAQAQQNQPSQTAPAQTDSLGPATAPDGMSSHGGTGGAGNASTTGSASSAPRPPDDQPLMATGQDLRGPPTRFPANKTPE